LEKRMENYHDKQMEVADLEKQLKDLEELLVCQKKLTGIFRLKSLEVGKEDKMLPEINQLNIRLYRQKKNQEEL
jgi:hypothetical protein